MRICVVGCGAVGSLFAANLATLDDVEVWAFDLNKEHVDAIKKNGLQLVGAGEVVGRPNATSDSGELPPCDFGIMWSTSRITLSARWPQYLQVKKSRLNTSNRLLLAIAISPPPCRDRRGARPVPPGRAAHGAQRRLHRTMPIVPPAPGAAGRARPAGAVADGAG